MEKRHVTKNYLQWAEGKLGERQRERVEAHLQSCRECREHFEKMSAVFSGKADVFSLPYLEADPFLPTRIKALAEERAKSSAAGKRWQWSGAFRLAFSTLMLVAALAIGIFLGKNLVGDAEYAASELVSDYYQEFSQQSYASSWEYILEENGGEAQ